MSRLSAEYDRYIRSLSADIRESECALIELGAESARRFDLGESTSGNRVQRVLKDLRDITERRERMVRPNPPPTSPGPGEPSRSQLDELRARRAARGT